MRERDEGVEGIGGRRRVRASHHLTQLALLSPALLLLWCADASGFDAAVEPVGRYARTDDLWFFLPFGYLLTVAIETPILLLGLPKKLSFKQRLFAGLWLTACTYPIVVLVLPVLLGGFGYGVYLLVAEVFAPVAECALFWLVFRERMGPGARAWVRSFTTIVLANLLSFFVGVVLAEAGWLG